MHPFFSSPHNVPAFLVKLWTLVSDPSTDELISWTHNGSSFTIQDSERFARELLPRYFKHSNTASFIRQLNMYGFRKVMNIDKVSDSRVLEFQHAFFSHDKVELLANIKRRPAMAKVVEHETSNDPTDILNNLSTLREKQKNMDSTLTKMKKENELLWRELSTVRQRHKAQEQLLHKVIQFLVQIIQRSNQNIHVPRKLARMLQDHSASQENSVRVARIADALRDKDSECIIVPDEAATSPSGAVIHEVTDFEPEVSNRKISSVPRFTSSILKPLSASQKNSLAPNSAKSSVTSSLEPMNVSENHQEKSNLLFEEPTVDKSSINLEQRYVALPVPGDPNQLILIPEENFMTQGIIMSKDNSSYNVIPLPDKIVDSSATSVLHKNLGDFFIKNGDVFDSTKEKTDSLLKSSRPTDIVTDDSVLSDLLQPLRLQTSKISSIDDEHTNDSELGFESMVTESPIEEDASKKLDQTENSNNQLAIPGPSSLIKSTKNCVPDFNILQDTFPPPYDFETMEQLFNSNYPLLENHLYNDKDVNMGNPCDDISGNELVQIPQKYPDSSFDSESFHWQDFLNPEDPSLFTDLMNEDFSLLESSSNDGVLSSNLDAAKTETELTNPCHKIPSCSEKKVKRRKVK